jgi:hypothetical protein
MITFVLAGMLVAALVLGNVKQMRVERVRAAVMARLRVFELSGADAEAYRTPVPVWVARLVSDVEKDRPVHVAGPPRSASPRGWLDAIVRETAVLLESEATLGPDRAPGSHALDDEAAAATRLQLVSAWVASVVGEVVTDCEAAAVDSVNITARRDLAAAFDPTPRSASPRGWLDAIVSGVAALLEPEEAPAVADVVRAGSTPAGDSEPGPVTVSAWVESLVAVVVQDCKAACSGDTYAARDPMLPREWLDAVLREAVALLEEDPVSDASVSAEVDGPRAPQLPVGAAFAEGSSRVRAAADNAVEAATVDAFPVVDTTTITAEGTCGAAEPLAAAAAAAAGAAAGALSSRGNALRAQLPPQLRMRMTIHRQAVRVGAAYLVAQVDITDGAGGTRIAFTDPVRSRRLSTDVAAPAVSGLLAARQAAGRVAGSLRWPCERLDDARAVFRAVLQCVAWGEPQPARIAAQLDSDLASMSQVCLVGRCCAVRHSLVG